MIQGNELGKLSKEVEAKDAEFKQFENEDNNLKEDLKNTNVRSGCACVCVCVRVSILFVNFCLSIYLRRKKLMQLNKLEKEKLERLEVLPEQNREKITECTEQRDRLEKKASIYKLFIYLSI